MTDRRPPTEPEPSGWKQKMGVELSGLERPRDFLIAFVFLATFVAVAAGIAYVMFG